MGKKASIIIGIIGGGLTIAFYFLPKVVPMMPTVVNITGLTVGCLLVIFGIVSLFTDKPWRIIMSIRFRLPFFMKQNNNQPVSAPAVQTSSTDYVQRYADWMTAAIQDDRSDLSGCVRVDEPHICWEHLEVKRGDAYIEFNFNIWSSSVLLLEINKQVEGHIWFQDGELERIPEITQKASQLSHLRRSKVAQLTIRQWLSFTVKVEMKIEHGRQVEFDFSKVNISVVATLPDSSQGHLFRLPIPDKISAQMPNHPNAQTLDKEDSQPE